MQRLVKMIIFLSALLSVSSESEGYTIISNRGKPAHWPTNTTSYHFNTTPSGYFTGGVDASGTVTDEFQPIRRAFATWMNLPGMTMSVTEDASSNQAAVSGDHSNTLSWVPKGWRNLSFKPPSNALAVTLLSFDNDTGAITDADIYFNAESFKWAVVDSTTENDHVDVQNIATHEIGHFFGLDHSSESIYESQPVLADATMYYASSTGETTRRDLHQDDISAVTSLYGASSRGIPKISSVEITSNSAGSLQYHISGSGFNEYTSFVLTKNSSSQLDAVARYRTINSGTDATAEFDVAGMSNGSADLVAFNDPTNLARFSVNLDSASLNATSANGGGGGGGCTLQSKENFSPLIFIFLFLISISLLSLRKKETASKGYVGRVKFFGKSLTKN
ncbi:MAG: hypothetical protein JWQ35_2513 [Bacteriovoracaceae bacterium]|nr:hypothetical protein [Bacteriovoracaceae bacterium]